MCFRICVCLWGACQSELRSKVFLKEFFRNYPQHPSAKQNVNHSCHGSNKRNIQSVAWKQRIPEAEHQLTEKLKLFKKLQGEHLFQPFWLISLQPVWSPNTQKIPFNRSKSIQCPFDIHHRQSEGLSAFSWSQCTKHRVHCIQIRCSLVLLCH